MEFDEMKTIWDSQNQEPLYAMKEAALHAIVQRKTQKWNRCLSRCFAAEITVGLGCGALMFICAGRAHLWESRMAGHAYVDEGRSIALGYPGPSGGGWNLVLLLGLHVAGEKAPKTGASKHSTRRCVVTSNARSLRPTFRLRWPEASSGGG